MRGIAEERYFSVPCLSVLAFRFSKEGILRRYSALLVILGSALWATDALFRRPLTGMLSPVTIVFLEHCVLGVIMFPIILRCRREFLGLKGRDYLSLIFIAIGGSVAATILFTYAIKYGNPSVAILLQKTQPLMTVLLARLILGERPARWFWPCFAAACAGAYMMSSPDTGPDQSKSFGHLAVSACAIGAAALWGSATVCGRYLVVKVSTQFLTGLRFLFALPALVVLYLSQPTPERALPGGSGPAAAIIAMALIPGLLALLLYYRGLRGTIASVASICELSFPITAVAVNWWVLDVRLAPLQLFGAILLVTSVTTLAWMHSQRPASAPSPGSKLIHS
jgi:drug/metabolite transporter (DMT)-like permease